MGWWFALVLVYVSCSGACPLWHIYNSSSGECQCGDSLGGAVVCESDSKLIKLYRCYCMTYRKDLNMTVVGPCNAMCVKRLGSYTSYNVLDISDDVLMLDSKICGYFNREGQLCGRCADGYGPPVYSYSLECVECSESDFKSNLLKYMAVAFLPLTVFYLGAVMFKLSVTSGNMVAFVLVCQIVSTPSIQRYIMQRETAGYRLLVASYSIWNLDFFRTLHTPFCIHPKVSTLHVLALDYLVGVYPLFLIFLTYIAVTLHDRYPIVVKIWRPAYRVFMCIRREWNIRGSLIQAFATFLVLSYVKILNVSFDLLTPVYLKTPQGETLNETYLYNAGELVYFGREHLPFGVLAVLMLTLFNVLPAVLLLLYPCRWFRKCLSCCGLNNHILHTFMDAFQGCYRHAPRDCRYFAALYLIFRILNILSFSLLTFKTGLALSCFILIVVIMVVAYTSPYKQQSQNKIDTIFLLLVVSCFPLTYLGSSMSIYNISHGLFKFILIVVSMIPIFFGFKQFLCKLLPKNVQVTVTRACHLLHACIKTNDVEQGYLYRFETEESPLLAPN